MGAETTVTVSIGRNIGNTPMSEEQWANYTADVTRAVRRLGQRIHFAGWGEGTYAGEQEESFTLVAGVLLPRLSDLRSSLAQLAKWHEQDSIAVTAGSTRIVRA